MKGKTDLKPGNSVQGDSNSRHPHGDILNVRGFYDQNSHVMPENPVEVDKELVKGEVSHWVEYVPECYDGSSPAPLVISCHGGGQSGWGQAYATSWMDVADREGFIVIFPDAAENRAWRVNREPGRLDPENKDVRLMCALIEEMKAKYNIDEGRVFMQGMSMGDLMTMQFARACGEKLAGAGCAAGPSPIEVLFTEDGQLREHTVPVPVFQSRGEHDAMAISGGYDGKATRYDINRANLKFWQMINGCGAAPQFRIEGEDNFAYFKGEHADVIFRDVKKRGHGQTFDDADIIWRQFFSGLSRRNGRIVREETEERAEGDADAVILAAGCTKIYLNNRILEREDCVPYNVQDVLEPPKLPEKPQDEEPKDALGHRRMPEFPKLTFDPCLYAPLGFFEEAFGVKTRTEEDGRKAYLTMADGRTLQAAAGNIGCVVDGRIRSMSRAAEWKDGKLYLPVKWFACNLFGYFAAENNEVLYLSRHYGEMTNDMAALIREYLS